MESTLRTLSTLTSPLETTLKGSSLEDSPEEWLNGLLRVKLEEVLGAPLAPEEDVRWRFVEHSLETLSVLRDQIVEESRGSDGIQIKGAAPLLSVQNQKCITSLLQLILGMGIVPYLIKGVRLALEKRSKYVEVFAKQGDIPVEKKRIRIAFVTNSLLDLSRGPEELAAIIITKNFGDILAALIQLGYAPLSKPKEQPDPSGFIMTPELYESLSVESQDFKTKYTAFIDRVYQPLVVKYLLVLQSGKGVPKWVKEAVGGSLSSRLLLPNGVVNVITGVLDVGGGEDDKKAKIIASVLANPPSTYSYGDTEHYYELLCPQVIHILKNGSPTYKKIACEVIRSISERSLTLSRRHLFAVLLDPLLPLTKETSPEVAQLPSEETLSQSIETLHFLFVLGMDPCITFLGHLEPAIDVLLNLHCSVTFGVSHLRNPVQELLVRYLKYSTQEHSLSVLKCFAFGEPPSRNDHSRVLKMNPRLRFMSGETGGMSVGLIDFDEKANFYVQEDEKSIAIVDLVTGISQDLTLEMYMLLLGYLGEIMSGGDAFNTELKSEDVSTEEKLLRIERDLDDTMSQLKKNLMIIRLLGLMSEDETLQENISKNSSRMIRFISMTIERGAFLTRKRMKADEESECSSGVLESQSISMALTILSLHLTQSRSVKSSDWEDLREMSDSFQALEDHHEDERIRALARKLRTFIYTHGVVVDSTKDLKGKVDKIKESTKRLKDMANTLKELEEEEKSRSPFQNAIYDLTDPLLPVRGSALIRLSKLLEDGDSEALERIDQIFNIFIQNLGDEDTYIYLSSINGLVSVGARSSDPEKVLHRLLSEFGTVGKRREDTSEAKIKVGEALVKITCLMGDVTPKFKNLLLNGFIHHLNDEDELMRSSTLSNLGEVAKNLKFSLGPDVDEIMAALDGIIKLDKSLLVRRSAVLVLSLTIEGLGENIFSVLKDRLKDVYSFRLSAHQPKICGRLLWCQRAKLPCF
eukprot:TRINITY_DN4207_c0_g1_i2.p1 TRINITY_DN4207_c0_g1~~TRINITY_DN4207_c0_g1_i2.p1  ORF type:complete len:978 (+),score=245.92 TRINITY_DN4207_c0_g1_i2:190-3123(+)